MKAIVLYSGGLDSTTLLHQILSNGGEAIALTFDYGQRHKKEIECAKRTCKKLGVEHIVKDISNLSDIFGNTYLLSDKKEIPTGDDITPTLVPNRNMIFIAIATALCIARGYDTVAYGALTSLYPDCSVEFVERMQDAIMEADKHDIELYTPYIYSDKKEIVEMAKLLDVDIDDTWSCYAGTDKPCGVCGACVKRNEGLNVLRDEEVRDIGES